jgi:hypothetical protein
MAHDMLKSDAWTNFRQTSGIWKHDCFPLQGRSCQRFIFLLSNLKETNMLFQKVQSLLKSSRVQANSRP